MKNFFRTMDEKKKADIIAYAFAAAFVLLDIFVILPWVGFKF